MNPAQTSHRKLPWGCLIASGLTSLLGLSILCGALILIFPPPWLRRPTAISTSAAEAPGVIEGIGNTVSKTATNAPTLPAATAALTATPTVTPTPPPPTVSSTPEPPPPTPDTEGPPAATVLGPTNNLRIPCGMPVSVALSWEAPSDPSGVDSYRVRLQETGADFSGEQVFDPVTTSPLDVSIETGCGRSYRWSVLARDGVGNQGVASDWASFEIDSATLAPAILGPKDYKHLSCVAQIILRWEAPDDPDGIFGYQVSLQTVLGAGYGEAQIFGWMVPTQKDVSTRTECNSTYRWRVFASDQILNQGPWSDWAYFIVNPPGQ